MGAVKTCNSFVAADLEECDDAPPRRWRPTRTHAYLAVTARSRSLKPEPRAPNLMAGGIFLGTKPEDFSGSWHSNCCPTAELTVPQAPSGFGIWKVDTWILTANPSAPRSVANSLTRTQMCP